MKVQILRTTVADKRFVHAGQVVDLNDIDARALILLGKAIRADDEPAEEKPSMMTTENISGVVDSAPARKGRRRAV